MNTRNLRSIYQLKIKLLGIKPMIWRRLLVSSVMKLDELHIAIQIAMGWTNSHLYEFISGYDRYGVPDDNGMLKVYDAGSFRIDSILKKEKDELLYLYDYGDTWEHNVLLEKVLPFTTEQTLPYCVAGKQACPPEDVGGAPGYAYFLEAIEDPSHPDHDEQTEWVGGFFDAEHFDLVEVNDLLSEYCS